jgi:ABC-type sugar transport system ATPase subunit
MSAGSITVECLGVRTDLSETMAWRLADSASNGPVLVGIRPHDLHLADEAPTQGPVVKARVDICEHTGTEVFATVDLGDAKLIARLPRSPVPVTGDVVSLAFNRDRVHLFDVETRMSLVRRQQEREKISVGQGEAASQ